MEEIKDRIQQYIIDKNMSSAQFADSIRVQRSSISHILSGRNKPSIDFIQKMLERYKDIDSNWLITGNKQQISDYKPKNDLELPFENEKSEQNSAHSQEKSEIFNSQPFQNTNKKIDRIVVFYADRTFLEYTPTI